VLGVAHRLADRVGDDVAGGEVLREAREARLSRRSDDPFAKLGGELVLVVLARRRRRVVRLRSGAELPARTSAFRSNVQTTRSSWFVRIVRTWTTPRSPELAGLAPRTVLDAVSVSPAKHGSGKRTSMYAR